MSDLTLVGDQVRLEPLELEHVPVLMSAVAEDPTLFGLSTVPLDAEAMTVWVSNALAGRDAATELPFAVWSRAHGRIVGSTRFYDLQRWQASAQGRGLHDRPDARMVGYTWLAASAQRTACNTEAKLLMLTHAFETWGAKRIAFRVDARNGRSRTAVQRLGAVFEGVRRAERIGADGQVRDSAFYSILNEEWASAKQRLMRLLQSSPSSTITKSPAAVELSLDEAGHTEDGDRGRR